MTEAEWLMCEQPKPMLRFLALKESERKLRLFSVTCVRRVWPLLKSRIGRTAVEAAEQCADGQLKAPEAELAEEKIWLENRMYALEKDCIAYANGISSAEKWVGWNSSEMAEYYATIAAGECARNYLSGSEWVGHADWIAEASADAAAYSFGGARPDDDVGVAPSSAELSERAAQTEILRDIFGNPFRPVTFSPTWRTNTAVALAAQMYESRCFDAMPILGDALQDAGCDNDDILNHCRAESVHVRGCWVVDLVLDRV